MFFDHDIRFERARTKRRMQEKEESILFSFIGAFFKALFGKSSKSKSFINNKKRSSKKKQSKNQVHSANLGAVSNSSNTSNALFLIAIVGVAAASTYVIAKKVYSDKEN